MTVDMALTAAGFCLGFVLSLMAQDTLRRSRAARLRRQKPQPYIKRLPVFDPDNGELLGIVHVWSDTLAVVHVENPEKKNSGDTA